MYSEIWQIYPDSSKIPQNSEENASIFNTALQFAKRKSIATGYKRNTCHTYRFPKACLWFQLKKLPAWRTQAAASGFFLYPAIQTRQLTCATGYTSTCMNHSSGGGKSRGASDSFRLVAPDNLFTSLFMSGISRRINTSA